MGGGGRGKYIDRGGGEVTEREREREVKRGREGLEPGWGFLCKVLKKVLKKSPIAQVTPLGQPSTDISPR